MTKLRMTKQVTRVCFVCCTIVVLLFTLPLLQILEKIKCKLSGFEPQLARLRFQLGNRSSSHAKKVLCFARFLSARANALQKILF